MRNDAITVVGTCYAMTSCDLEFRFYKNRVFCLVSVFLLGFGSTGCRKADKCDASATSLHVAKLQAKNMEKYSFITIYTLALLLKLTSGQIVVPCSMDTSPYKGPPIPKIPDSFAADIVKTYVNQKQGMVYDTGVDHLYFDAQRKVAVQGKLFSYFTINY